jgi:hypothetical protein
MLQLLEQDGRIAGAMGEARHRHEEDAGSQRFVRCARCGHRITSPASRSEPGGAHEHTFMNPGGFVYVIRCFAAAPGCSRSGEESSEWSWFPGHLWQVALCGRCRCHLGWSFRRAASEVTFFGLIAERVVHDDDPRAPPEGH